MILVNFEDGTEFNSNLSVQTLSTQERLKRSAKIFLVFFALAFFSIFIPILHFVLVPGFLLASIISFIILFNQSHFISLNEFKCPKCHGSLNQKDLYLKSINSSTKVFCGNCRNNMRLNIKK